MSTWAGCVSVRRRARVVVWDECVAVPLWGFEDGLMDVEMSHAIV